MGVTSSNLRDLEVVGSEKVYFLWREAVLDFAVAKLSIFAVAPAIDTALCTQTERVLPPTSYLDNLLLLDYASNHRWHKKIARSAVAKLAKDATAPCVDFAFITDGSCVMVSARKLGEGHLACLATHHLDVSWNLEALF